MIIIWLAYILSEGDHRKVVVRGWVEQRQQTIEQVCGIKIRETDFSDDRLSIVLKHLSDDQQWSLIEQQLNRRTVRVYDLRAEKIRLDATTVSGEHGVNEEGLFQLGHSKDDPNLAQVKVVMADLDPLGMPLATQVVSGEKSDDGMYIAIFDQVRVSLNQSDLLWVGDCKMGAIATRSHIHHHQHYYLMPLPRTAQVPQWLRQWLREMRESVTPLASIVVPRTNSKGSIVTSILICDPSILSN